MAAVWNVMFFESTAQAEECLNNLAYLAHKCLWLGLMCFPKNIVTPTFISVCIQLVLDAHAQYQMMGTGLGFRSTTGIELLLKFIKESLHNNQVWHTLSSAGMSNISVHTGVLHGFQMGWANEGQRDPLHQIPCPVAHQAPCIGVPKGQQVVLLTSLSLTWPTLAHRHRTPPTDSFISCIMCGVPVEDQGYTRRCAFCTLGLPLEEAVRNEEFPAHMAKLLGLSDSDVLPPEVLQSLATATAEHGDAVVTVPARVSHGQAISSTWNLANPLGKRRRQLNANPREARRGRRV